MIVFQSVSKYYGETPALENISLRIEPGKVNVLLGPNGSGKTTLMKLILGIIKPDTGKIVVYGHDPARDPIPIRRIIGYVPEDDALYHSLRVKEYLEFVARIYGLKQDIAKRSIERVIDAFMLRDKINEFIGSLSHGYKRRVLLAAAFIHDPLIYLLDEPFIGIDPRIARALKTVLKNKATKECLILLSTHVLEIAEALADNIILLYKGRIISTGSVEEVLEKARTEGLEEAFLSLTRSKLQVEEIIKALMG
ncbi:ABC transporter related [Staphylothermus marinus F1]|uniref:ABC transporter related n=1 Tax=Staphylothermus marinus (strain ATCC 43588 / DSM 3639 / JCM 9404 / F1) TaxID=399550 RepID=A3DLK6_STAMF|nr:ABC transporter ATP-binding protein [Staphylothermus marinus]ABN69516.1 ABC transporter related [Staphylothermus marinus F1]